MDLEQLQKINQSTTASVERMMTLYPSTLSSSSSLLVWMTTAIASTGGNATDYEDGVTTASDAGVDSTYNWSFICVMVFVVAGTVGNVLVCLAVWLERPLQNVTNWFLVSLAFADLIVSTIVMPFGATAGFLGV